MSGFLRSARSFLGDGGTRSRPYIGILTAVATLMMIASSPVWAHKNPETGETETGTDNLVYETPNTFYGKTFSNPKFRVNLQDNSPSTYSYNGGTTSTSAYIEWDMALTPTGVCENLTTSSNRIDIQKRDLDSSLNPISPWTATNSFAHSLACSTASQGSVYHWGQDSIGFVTQGATNFEMRLVDRNTGIVYMSAQGSGSYIIPKAPTNLQITYVSTSSISLSWLNNARFDNFYEVWRATDPNGTWTKIAQPNDVAQGATATYTDSTVSSGVEYWYKVRAINGSAQSGWSNIVAAKAGIITTNWWPGEGNANDVAGSQSGTLVNGTTFASGKVGQGFSFDGTNDHVTFGNVIGDVTAADFTLAFWIKTSSTRQETILSKRPVCGHASYLDIRLAPSGSVYAELDGSSSGSNYNLVQGDAVVNDGTFHHVALVRKGTTASLYVDGLRDGSNSTGGITHIDNTAKLTAGKSVCIGVDGTNYFTGVLDELMIGPDQDADGHPNAVDNCPDEMNGLQEDYDSDGVGEVCQDPIAVPESPPFLEATDSCNESASVPILYSCVNQLMVSYAVSYANISYCTYYNQVQIGCQRYYFSVPTGEPQPTEHPRLPDEDDPGVPPPEGWVPPSQPGEPAWEWVPNDPTDPTWPTNRGRWFRDCPPGSDRQLEKLHWDGFHTPPKGPHWMHVDCLKQIFDRFFDPSLGNEWQFKGIEL